ncbi:MAG: hypothetical protein JXR94_01475, partial [Candidatus Hydrogenedentes bacterium]|nr:hypothetical protein [Candidatus Hydrogenedentota bacterium]
APGDFWIVADTLAPRDDQPHRYESVFHLDAPGVDTESVPFGVCTQDEGGPNLGLFALAAEGLSLTVVEGQEEPVIQGWIPLDDSTLTGVRPIPTPVFAAERAGVAHALYVLYPVAEGPVPAVAVTPWSVPGAAPEDGASAGIAFAGGPRYRVFFAENPGRAWEVDGETATGPFWLGRLDGGAWRRIED